MASDDSALRIYVIGLCMGTADGVPGVSGGTIALIAGIYTRLIDAITNATPGVALDGLAALWPPTSPDTDALREVAATLDVRFLLPLGLGVGTAIVLVTRAVEVLARTQPVLLFGFFFGLIGASAVVLRRQVTLTTRRHWVAAVSGFALAFLLSGEEVTVLQGHALPLIVVAGAVAVSAMILPGISGSLILVVLGQYTYMAETLSGLIDRLLAAATGGGTDGLAGPALTVVAFLAGGVVGLLTISRAVEYALDRDRETTLAFLVALIVGALRAPVVTAGGEPGVTWTLPTVGEFAGAAVVGAVALYALDYYAVDVTVGEVDDDPARGAEPEDAPGADPE